MERCRASSVVRLSRTMEDKCEADGRSTWWGEAPERSKGFTGEDVLNGLV
jgi:hypothetical protein